MTRKLLILMVAIGLLSGCASYYDHHDDYDRRYDAYGYSDDVHYGDGYVVDEVVYGGHSYGGFGVGRGYGYAHDPYWRSSAFSLFYSDWPSYHVWSPYRAHYPGIGYNYGFSYGSVFLNRHRYDRFGFGYHTPYYGYTYRPRFSYFGFYSPRYYSPTYYYDYDRRDRRVVYRSSNPPSAVSEARRLSRTYPTGNQVYATRRQPFTDRSRIKDEGRAGRARTSRVAGTGLRAGNRAGTRADTRGRAGRVGAPAPRTAGRATSRTADSRVRSGNRTRDSLGGARTGRAEARVGRDAANRAGTRATNQGSTRSLSPRIRSTARPARTQDTARGRTAGVAGSNSRPVKIEAGGRSLTTRPAAPNRGRATVGRKPGSTVNRSDRGRQPAVVLPRRTSRSQSRDVARPAPAGARTYPAGRSGSPAPSRSSSFYRPEPQNTPRTAPRAAPRATPRAAAPRSAPVRRAQPAARAPVRAPARTQPRPQARSQARSQARPQARSQPRPQVRAPAAPPQRSAPARSSREAGRDSGRDSGRARGGRDDPRRR